MPRIDFSVDVESDDFDVDVEFLRKLRSCFESIVELHSWGYTDDELKIVSRTLPRGE